MRPSELVTPVAMRVGLAWSCVECVVVEVVDLEIVEEVLEEVPVEGRIPGDVAPAGGGEEYGMR